MVNLRRRRCHCRHRACLSRPDQTPAQALPGSTRRPPQPTPCRQRPPSFGSLDVERRRVICFRCLCRSHHQISQEMTCGLRLLRSQVEGLCRLDDVRGMRGMERRRSMCLSDVLTRRETLSSPRRPTPRLHSRTPLSPRLVCRCFGETRSLPISLQNRRPRFRCPN